MKIGIVDADLLSRRNHRHPNLVSMKLSAHHKSQGDDVTLVRSWSEILDYDQVYISKIFTNTIVPDEVLAQPNVQIGGTGFFFDKAEALPYEIEHIMPDYHLYDDFVKDSLDQGISTQALRYYTDFSIGFTTRGCIRHCPFCVNQKYSSCHKHSPVSEFLDSSRKYICCWDDNVLACPDWKEIFAELNATGKRFQFRQGMDERLLTDEKCDVIFNSNWIGEYIFAFDNIRDKDIIVRKLKMLRQHTDKRLTFYCFCGFNHDHYGLYDEDFYTKDFRDLFERIKILMSFGCLPYVMRYADYRTSPYAQFYNTVARWCNQPSFIRTKSFREFCYHTKGQNKGTPAVASAFEATHPDIAQEYWDLKWSDFCKSVSHST